MKDLVGTQLGGYELLQWLGEGAHVHAFLAKKPRAKTPVVIKVLKDSLAHDEAYLERFNHEAQAALELVHPNVVKVLKYSHKGDLLYLVETLLAGGSLMDIFVKTPGQPLPLDRVVRTLTDIASGLDFAHSRGIIHRDLKPENVLFDADGNAALSDLGITKTIQPDAVRTREDLEFGNPNYMSPEEWQGKTADPRTDIYALGVILFEMLTGQLPFTPMLRDSFVYVHLMHMMSTPLSIRELRPDLPPTVDPVIARAIEKDRDLRYPTAGELAREFRDALDGKAPASFRPVASAAPEKAAVSGLFAVAGAKAPPSNGNPTNVIVAAPVVSAPVVQAAPVQATIETVSVTELEALKFEVRRLRRWIGIMIVVMIVSLLTRHGRN
jgi:serine/threonine-protein kinase